MNYLTLFYYYFLTKESFGYSYLIAFFKVFDKYLLISNILSIQI